MELATKLSSSEVSLGKKSSNASKFKALIQKLKYMRHW
jgi:hypothetical protein